MHTPPTTRLLLLVSALGFACTPRASSTLRPDPEDTARSAAAVTGPAPEEGGDTPFALLASAPGPLNLLPAKDVMLVALGSADARDTGGCHSYGNWRLLQFDGKRLRPHPALYQFLEKPENKHHGASPTSVAIAPDGELFMSLGRRFTTYSEWALIRSHPARRQGLGMFSGWSRHQYTVTVWPDGVLMKDHRHMDSVHYDKVRFSSLGANTKEDVRKLSTKAAAGCQTPSSGKFEQDMYWVVGWSVQDNGRLFVFGEDCSARGKLSAEVWEPGQARGRMLRVVPMVRKDELNIAVASSGTNTWLVSAGVPKLFHWSGRQLQTTPIQSFAAAHALQVDGDGTLWLLGDKQLYRRPGGASSFEPQTLPKVHLAGAAEPQPLAPVEMAVEGAGGRLWINAVAGDQHFLLVHQRSPAAPSKRPQKLDSMMPPTESREECIL